MTSELEYRVKLRNTANGSDLVTFMVTPDLSESRTVNYKTVDPVHAPGQIYAFVNSSSRTFQLSGVKFVSRTQEEAEENINHLWRLKAWTMPAFGRDPLSANQRANREQVSNRARKNPTMARDFITDPRSTANVAETYGVDVRGAPPTVLELSAYAHDGHYNSQIGHINRVPVVITNLNIPYPSDVDYFPTTKGVPMPTILSIDLTLAETHSPREYENFSLSDYKKGILGGF